jgi:hypothetical protein
MTGESFGNEFVLDAEEDGGCVSVLLQEIIPIRKMDPSKYFICSWVFQDEKVRLFRLAAKEHKDLKVNNCYR